MEFKIAVVNDKDLYLLLKTLLASDYEISFFEYTRPEQQDMFLEKMAGGEIKAVIMDCTIYNIKETMRQVKAAGVKIILCDHDTDYKMLKDTLKEGLIVDYFEKSEYKNVVDILEKMKSRKGGRADKILIKEGNGGIVIRAEDIIKVYYERESKKSIIYTGVREIKIRKYLQDIEDMLSGNSEFLRADRGTIINTSRVMEMGEEIIIFDNGKKECYNRQVVKSVREHIIWNSALEI